MDASVCEALRSGHVLELRYDGFFRSVEVHAVGFTKQDNPVMLVWEVTGGSVSNEPVVIVPREGELITIREITYRVSRVIWTLTLPRLR